MDKQKEIEKCLTEIEEFGKEFRCVRDVIATSAFQGYLMSKVKGVFKKQSLKKFGDILANVALDIFEHTKHSFAFIPTIVNKVNNLHLYLFN